MDSGSFADFLNFIQKDCANKGSGAFYLDYDEGEKVNDRYRCKVTAILSNYTQNYQALPIYHAIWLPWQQDCSYSTYQDYPY